jgi:nitrite reductase/ring-hydroxylating ferredoxin subunit
LSTSPDPHDEASPGAPDGERFDTGLRPADLDPERPVPFDTPWGSLALYALAERVVAADSFCPHLAGPLFQGSVSAERVTCPWHGWTFSLGTGECVWAPDGVDRPAVRVRVARVSVGPRGTYCIHAPRDER